MHHYLGLNLFQLMIRTLSLILSLILLDLSAALAEPTSIAITVQNYSELKKGVRNIYDLIYPENSDEDFEEFMQDQLELFDGTNLEKPWQFVMWIETIQFTEWFHSLRVPIDDYEVFRQSFEKVMGADKATLTREGDYAKIWGLTQPNPELKKRHDDWNPSSLKPVDKLVNVSIELGESMRMEISQSLAMLEIMTKQGIKNAPPGELSGIDANAMAELLTYQFSIYRMFISDLQELVFSLDFTPAGVVLEERVEAKPESEMASYLRSPNADLGKLASMMDTSGMVQFVGQVGNNSKLLDSFKKMSLISMNIYGEKEANVIKKEFGEMMDKLLSMQYAGSIDNTVPMTFAYTYYYPDLDMEEFRKALVDVAEAMQPMSGIDKPFRQFAFQPDYATIQGTSVDRLLTVMNLDHKMFQTQTPEQRWAFNQFWNDGVMDIRIARKNDYMFMATVQEIGELLARTPSADQPDTGLNRNTIMYLQFSPFEVANWFVSMQGVELFEEMLSMQGVELFEEMPEPEGTDISIRVDFLDHQLYARTTVPFKFLSQLFGFMPKF